MNTLRKITYLLILIFICCTKKEDDTYEKKHVVVFYKNYKKLTTLKKENYLDSLSDFSSKIKKNDTLTRNLHLELATEYYYINNMNKSLFHSRKALRLSKEVNDSIREPKALFYIGDCYLNKLQDSAYFYYLQAEKLYLKIQDNDNTARMIYNKAHILFYDGNYIECEIEISNALHYLSKSKNFKLIYTCTNLMGNCLEKLANYDEALKYHKIALACLDTMRLNNIDKDEINNYNVTSIINICNLYDLKGEYSKSIVELQSLLTEELKNRWPILYANVLSNLAYSKMKSGDYNNVQSMFFEAINIVENSGIESDVLYKKIYLGEFYLTQKDTVKSIAVLKKANDIAKNIKSSNEIMTTLKLLSAIDKKNSLKYANAYISVSDSIYMVQKNTRHKYARIEFETSQLLDKNQVLYKDNLHLLFVCLTLLFLFIVISLARHLKYKNKELLFLKKQHKANEEIYQLLSQEQEKMNMVKENEKAKIAKELHDGIMNKIYGIRMNLGFMNAKIDEKIIKKRREYIDELQNIENEIRTISHDLSYTSFFDRNDFNCLLSNLIENHQNIIDTEFKFESDPHIDWVLIPNIYKINIYRIIQEAILNVSKYANARNCKININLNDFLELNIKDDGEGFNLKNKKKGIGLKNVNERVKSLNGHFKISSRKGKGTEINIMFNLDDLMRYQKYS